jgi:hypothetical protein
MKVHICFNELMFNYKKKKSKLLKKNKIETKQLNSMLSNIQLQKIYNRVNSPQPNDDAGFYPFTHIRDAAAGRSRRRVVPNNLRRN